MQLDDLAAVYREAPPVQRGGRTRVAVLALTGLCAAQVVAAVLAGDPWRLGSAPVYAVLTGGAVVLSARRPRQTSLTASGLLVRTSVFTQRTVAWTDVTGIRVQGRWDTSSTAIVRGGPPLPLPGLPRDRAERLARAVAGEPPTSTALPELAAEPRRARAGPVPPDALDMEAGFRRGRPRSGR